MIQQVRGTNSPTGSLRRFFVSAAVLLLFAALFVGAGAADVSGALASDSAMDSGKEIVSLSVSGLPQQLSGSPDAISTVQVTSSPSANVAVKKVSWSPDDDSFTAGTSYTVSVLVTAVGGNFSSSLDCTVNGYPASPVFFEDGSVLVEYTYSADAVLGDEAAAVPSEVPSVSREKISIAAPESLAFGEVGVLTAVYSDEDGNVDLSASLVFASADESVLRLEAVDANTAKIISMAPGETTITVSLAGDESVSETVEVYVTEPVTMTPFDLNGAAPGSSEIAISGTLNLTTRLDWGHISVYYTNWSSAEYDQEWKWNVENESVVGFFTNSGDSYSGYLYPRNVGVTNITVTSVAAPSLTTTAQIVVEETVISSLQEAGDQTFSLGTTGTIIIYPHDQFGNFIPYEKFNWKIVEGSALTLTSTDAYSAVAVLVNPVAEGTSVICATSISNSSVSETINVTIVNSSKILSIGYGNAHYEGGYWYSMSWSEPLHLDLSTRALGMIEAKVIDTYGNEFNSADISWDIEDESVISLTEYTDISHPGRWIYLKPLQTGTTNITVMADGITKVLTVSVSDTIVSSISPGLDGHKISVDHESGHSIHIYDQFGNPIYGETITLRVDNANVLPITQTTFEITENADSNNYFSLNPETTGTATLTFTVTGNSSITDTYVIEVVDTEISHIEFSDRDLYGLSIDSGSRYIDINVHDQFNSYIYPNDGFRWTSSDNSVLSVDGTGRSAMLTPKGIGTVTITVTSEDNQNLAISRTIVVEKTEISSVYLYCTEEMSLGTTGYAHAYARDQFGHQLPNEHVLWSVDTPSVISLSSNETTGSESITLYPQKIGTATLQAVLESDSSKRWSQTVEVFTTEPTRIDGYCQEKLSLLTTGYTYAYIYDQFGNTLSYGDIKWEIIEGAHVIQLQSYGGGSADILPLASGTAKIRATSLIYPQLEPIEFTITVEETLPTSINVWGSAELTISAIGSVGADVCDQFGNAISNADVIWTVTDGTNVLSIEQSGMYANLYPKGTGTAILTVKYAGNDALSKTFTVKIVATKIASMDVYAKTPLSLYESGHVGINLYDQYGYYIQNEKVEWKLINGSDVIELVDSGDQNGRYVTPLKTGSATVRATVENNTALFKDIVITVEASVPSELNLYGTKYFTIIGNQTYPESGYIQAEMRDQFGSSLYDENVTWEIVSGTNVVKLEDPSYTDSNNLHKNLVPIGEGTAVIKATSESNTTLSAKLYVNVTAVTDTITAETDKPSYYSGEAITLSGTNENGGTLYFYISDGGQQFNGFGSPVITNTDTTWSYTVSGSELPFMPHDTGTYTVYVSTTANVSSVEDLGIFTIAQVVLEPLYMTLTDAPAVATDIYVVNGTAPSTDSVRYYIFGTNSYFEQGSVPVDDRTFSIVVNASNLDSDQYFMVIQHPMYDKEFNLEVGTESPYPVSVNYSWSEPQFLFNIDDYQGGNAAEALCSAFDSQGIDDRYVKLSFVVGSHPVSPPPGTGGYAIINPIPSEVQKGTLLTVSGSTSMGEGTIVMVEMVSTAFAAAPLETVGSESFIALTTNTNELGSWEVTFDTSGLNIDEYLIRVYVGDLNPTSAKVNLVEEVIIAPPELPSPSITPAGGTFVEPREVTITANAGTIYYTVDGTRPSAYSMQYTGSFTISETTIVKAIAIDGDRSSAVVEAVFTKELPPSLVVPSPVISPEGGAFSESRAVTITADIGTIYYTLNGAEPTSASTQYTGSFTISETTTVKAIAIAETGEQSTVTEQTFIKDQPERTYTITVINLGDGGTVTVDKTTAKADEMVTINLDAFEGWKTAGWTITGAATGTVTDKTSAANGFAMWRESVIITGKFAEIEDPKAHTIKFYRLPGTLYSAEKAQDKGTLTAEVYDQFGARYTDTVKWSSSNTTVIEINEDSGAYTAKTPGQAVITATASSDSSVTAELILTVYVPPMPQINGEIHNGKLPSVEFGVMSEPFVVDTSYTSYLYWNWGDNSTSSPKVKYPYPTYTTSKDSVAHTFIKYGDLTVSVTPANNYREGDTKTFTVTVTHAVPSNLKITAGPKAVTAGDTATYTADASNAKSYVWYLNGNEISGQTGASAQITFPDNVPKNSVVSVKAYNGYDAYSAEVTKEVSVAEKGGALGSFGNTLTTSPAKPVVGDLTTFSITAVENAVKYHWKFANGKEYTTTASGVSHTITAVSETTVIVTAYNSAGKTAEKTYSISGIGEKPTISLSPKSTTATPGDTTTVTATGTAGTYTWYLNGNKVAAAGNSFTNTWKLEDIDTHTISVSVKTDYGTATDTATITVEAKEGTAPIIHHVNGKLVVSQGAYEKYHVSVHCKDDYTIEWYLDDVRMTDNGNKDPKFFEYTFKETGNHKLVVFVTTEYEMTASYTLDINVIDEKDYNSNKAKNADKKAAQETPVSPPLTEGSDTKNSLEAVSGLAFDQKDLNEDGEPVTVSVTALEPEDLKEFTNDMGQKGDMLLGLDIKPEGLKNEKDLSSYAIVTIQLPVSEVGDDPSQISFYRFDTGSDINGWEVLTLAEEPKKDATGNFWIFKIQTGGMSQFVATFGTASSEADATPLTPVKDTRAQMNAVIPAEVTYSISASQISSITAPTVTNGKDTIIMKNVTVTKSGSSEKVSASVGADGRITLSGTVSDTYSLTVTFLGGPLGDVTGDRKADTLDAARILQASAKLITLDDEATFYGDVAGNDGTNTFDAARILQYSAKLTDDNYNLKS